MAIVRMSGGGIKSTVLIVDDQATSRMILEQVARNLDPCIQVEAFERPSDAVMWASTRIADLVLVDYQLPEMDGIQLARCLKALPGYENVPIVMVTATEDKKICYGALDAGITDFILKPVDSRECAARCRNLLTLRRQQLSLENQKRMLEGMVQDATVEIQQRERETILRLAKAGEYRDEETGNHVVRMARYSALIAGALGMDADYVEVIERSAPLHDIGKIGIPDNILRKPGKLDGEEWNVMKQHAVMGYEILKDSPSKYLRMGALIALGHHEKVDGSGYPYKLVGDHIPLPARIVAVADVYDALTSARPYKDAWSREQAFEYLREGRGSHLDGDLVDVFVKRTDDVDRIGAALRDSFVEDRFTNNIHPINRAKLTG